MSAESQIKFAEYPRVNPRGSAVLGRVENLNPDPDPADPLVQTRGWTRYPCGTLASRASSLLGREDPLALDTTHVQYDSSQCIRYSTQKQRPARLDTPDPFQNSLPCIKELLARLVTTRVLP
ncbi:hypothetical protein B0H14DRAFT_2585099 [Mycena olivaceomarginata]|nr:hypothetical protein B0H14DRAFT_2585099 [Mycena olivaceomarginata]